MLNTRKVVDDTIAKSTPRGLNIPPERRKFRYLVQPEEDFVFHDPQEENKNKEKTAKRNAGLYIPIRKGQNPKNSEEFKILQQIAGMYKDQLYDIAEDGRVFIPPHYLSELGKDLGFKLLHDIAYNDEGRSILFTIADSLEGIDRKTGNLVRYDIYNRQKGTFLVDMNFSITERNDTPRVTVGDKADLAAELWNIANALPSAGFDGSVAVPKNDYPFKDTKGENELALRLAPPKKLISRAFHALAENYLRTIKGIDFKDGKAHREAAEIEKKLKNGDPRKSLFPGSHSTVIIN